MSTIRRARVFLTTLVLAMPLYGFGPDGPGGKVTKEQLDYSKQMYAEGEKAMEAGKYDEAIAKFREGYRYAPHLHVFTFNIASAADAAGDCRTAMTYFQMFIDLVPEHKQRAAARKRLEQLQKDCPVDTEAPPPTEADIAEAGAEIEPSGGAEERRKRAALRAMNEAYASVRSAQQMYDAAKTRYPDQPFAKAARRKAKHAKKVLKLATKLGVSVEVNGFDTLDVPGDAKGACREAERQEKDIIEAMEAALEHYDTKQAYRTLGKAMRGAERDAFSFDACS